MDGLRKAIEAAGSSTALAGALGVSIQRLTNWAARGVPVEMCPRIERYTRQIGSPVPCEELRPDIDWAVLREFPADKVA